MDSIKDIAIKLNCVTSWLPDNQPIPEAHVTQIMQSALNMPTALNGGVGKGTFMFVPHRSEGGLVDFRNNVLRKHYGCNLDTTFNHIQTCIVFGICNEESDDTNHPKDQTTEKVKQERLKETEWFNNLKKRIIENRFTSYPSGLGKEIPYFIKNQLVTHTLALGAAALECRRLGHPVQFFTVDKLCQYFWYYYPNIVNGKPYLPLHCIITGTSPERAKTSPRRNRSHELITDKDSMIQSDIVPLNLKNYQEYNNFLITPNDHVDLVGTYKEK